VPRSIRERVLQTALFETGGLLLAVPLYEALLGQGGGSPLPLLAAITLAVLVWSPLHNLLFDQLDQKWTGRSPSMRPHPLRMLHALSHEVTPIAVTLPLIMLIGGHSLTEALALNGGLSLLYVVYAYLFYWAYDRLRAVMGDWRMVHR
jgi:uncharacterized membrane protein